MKLSKVTALVAAGVLLFGTSLFSRNRDNPSWAWASSGAAAASLSDMAAPNSALQAIPSKELSPAVQDARAQSAPASASHTPVQAPAASKPAVVPAPHGAALSRSTSADRACAGKPCRRSPQRSRTMSADAAPKPAFVPVEPIQFRLADGRL